MAPTRLSAKAKLREALDEFALASDETKKPELRLADVATDKDAGREQLVVLFTPPKDKGTAQPPPTAHDKRDPSGREEQPKSAVVPPHPRKSNVAA